MAVAKASPSSATTIKPFTPWLTMLSIWSICSFTSWLASCDKTSYPLSSNKPRINTSSFFHRSVAKSENESPTLMVSLSIASSSVVSAAGASVSSVEAAGSSVSPPPQLINTNKARTAVSNNQNLLYLDFIPSSFNLGELAKKCWLLVLNLNKKRLYTLISLSSYEGFPLTY